MQNLDHDQIEEERKYGDGQHPVALDFRRLKEAHGGLVDQKTSHDPDGENRHESTHDLDSVVPKSEMFICLAMGNFQCGDRYSETKHIRGNVSCIRHDSN